MVRCSSKRGVFHCTKWARKAKPIGVGRATKKRARISPLAHTLGTPFGLGAGGLLTLIHPFHLEFL
jgi:hypothetical protein